MKISKELKVGLFMVLATVLLYLGFWYLKGSDFFSTSKKYYAIYDNVDKLMVSNQVYLNGFQVGRVNDIRILQSKNNRVIVEIAVRSEVVLTDSTVAILSSDFLGNKSILLDMGRRGEPLVPGDTVTSALEKGLADLLEKADPVADNLQATLRKLNSILDNLVSHTGSLDTIFLEFKRVPRQLNVTMDNANANMDRLAAEISLLAANTNNVINGLKPVLSNIKAFSDSLRGLKVNEALQNLQSAVERLNQSLERLSSKDNTMSKLLTEDTLYVNLNKTLLRIDSLANHLNQYPKHFFAPLGKSHRRVERDLKEEE